MTTFFPGNTRFTLIMVWAAPAPITPGSVLPGLSLIHISGDITGVEEASSAMEEGNLAGIAAAEALGYFSKEEAEEKKAAVRERLNTLRSGQFGQKRREAKQQQMANMEEYTKTLEGGAQG